MQRPGGRSVQEDRPPPHWRPSAGTSIGRTGWSASGGKPGLPSARGVRDAYVGRGAVPDRREVPVEDRPPAGGGLVPDARVVLVGGPGAVLVRGPPDEDDGIGVAVDVVVGEVRVVVAAVPVRGAVEERSVRVWLARVGLFCTRRVPARSVPRFDCGYRVPERGAPRRTSGVRRGGGQRRRTPGAVPRGAPRTRAGAELPAVAPSWPGTFDGSRAFGSRLVRPEFGTADHRRSSLGRARRRQRPPGLLANLRPGRIANRPHLARPEEQGPYAGWHVFARPKTGVL